uniref:ditrans,polycis-polyprenyl diphosphate synthase [(2E,6E)-farnesyldiphosphate specific] n=1 Tax=Eptatretus burgeri TaxID=7764 RepID=A0A8C4RA74_EPTBU
MCPSLRSQADAGSATTCQAWWRSTLTLPRRPTHIGVVVTGTRGNRASVSPRELATLVVWCVAGGVSFVTVYDALGECSICIFHDDLNARGVTLLDEIVRRHKEILQADWSKFPLEIVDSRWKTSSQKCEWLPRSLHMRYLEKLKGLETLKHFLVVILTSSSLPGFPDPDLVLRLGPVQSTLGYLPWHLRLSEIIPMHSITYSNFLEALHTFAACQPRFGK